MDPFRAVALIPTLDNPMTLRAVVEATHRHVPDVIVVDDGSREEGRAVARALAREGRAHVLFRPKNGGKGRAVKEGLLSAREAGFTHAVQLDADGQHDAEDIPKLLEAARAHPEALVIGAPIFDDTAPRSRLFGRRLSVFWCRVETGGLEVDPLFGFRVYPVEAALRAGARGNAMDFDPEIVVRMVWDGAHVVRVPTRVRYLEPEEGGVSHFRMVRDNVLISGMHTRLAIGAMWRALRGAAEDKGRGRD